MPRNARSADDLTVTLRLKHGIHTIFLFADLDWTVSRLTEELSEVLREQYESLTSVPGSVETPVPPADQPMRIAYALPKNPEDLAMGWKSVKAKKTETLGELGFTDFSVLAFALLGEDESEVDARFLVEVPVLEEE